MTPPTDAPDAPDPAALAAAAHAALDEIRRVRRFAGALQHPDRPAAVAVVVDATRRADALAHDILAQADDRALVIALPVAIRIAVIRTFWEVTPDAPSLPPVETLIARLGESLDVHALDGDAWAVLALWQSLTDQRVPAAASRSRAFMRGSGDLYAREVDRIGIDVGLTDDA